MNDVILSLVARNFMPFILVYGFHLIFHGHVAPVGGFSGGTSIAATAILAVLVWGLEGTGLRYRDDALCGIQAVTLLSYVAVGAAAWLVSKPFLGVMGTFPMGLVGELSIGLMVGVTITGIFIRLSEATDGHSGSSDD